MVEVTKKDIQEDVKKIFDRWQTEEKKTKINEDKLKRKYGVVNLEPDEDKYTFQLKDEDGIFMVSWQYGEPIVDCPMTENAEKFAQEFYQLCQISYDKVREFIEKLGYFEWDDDVYYSAWKKGDWIVTVPAYPQKLEEIEIDKDEPLQLTENVKQTKRKYVWICDTHLESN